jgi:hypothetical protein
VERNPRTQIYARTDTVPPAPKALAIRLARHTASDAAKKSPTRVRQYIGIAWNAVTREA